MPECRSRDGPVSVTSMEARPRSIVVMAGVSLSHCPVSQTSTTSAFSSLPYSARNAGSEGEPHSSSPSSITETEIGNLPATAFQARTASKKVISWPLLSSAPRATITCPLAASEMMIGSNGGRGPQIDGVGRLHVVVAVEQHVRRARGAARPCRARRPSDARWSARRAPRTRGRKARWRTIRPPPGSSPCRRGRSTRSRCARAGTAAPAPHRSYRPASSALGLAVSLIDFLQDPVPGATVK